MFFICVYLHTARGLMYESYRKPRELIWIFGVLIYLTLMGEAFFGYLLPWGQTERRFLGYRARGVPYGPDDGKIAGWAVATSLAYAPEFVLPTLGHLYERYPETSTAEVFLASFNPTFPDLSRKLKFWVCKSHYGINQGPVVLAIENYRSGLLWRLMRQCPNLVSGLRRACFSGGWLIRSCGPHGRGQHAGRDRRRR